MNARLGHRLIAGSLLAGVLLVVGCAPRETGTTAQPAPPAPPYAQIARLHNERVQHLDRIWCRTVVVLEWLDEDGKRHKEQGEGHLQFIRYPMAERQAWGDQIKAPARIAMDVGKVGNIGLWLGCNADRFWWIDIQEEDAAYVAHHTNIGQPCCQPLSLPFHPIELIELLALIELPEEDAAQPRVETSTVQPVWRVTMPGTFSERRLEFDAFTHRVSRVELLDAQGEVYVWSELTDYQPVEITGMAPTQWPTMPRVIRMGQADDRLSAKITLNDPMDARHDPRKLRDAAFSFPTVRRSLGPKTIIVLDADCTGDTALNETQ
ncbi:MAG: hypothetical protein KAS72_06660 [Phycisphaerales bacterium]|nr:hypothetical protein [Phycisphaerales bacterium]